MAIISALNYETNIHTSKSFYDLLNKKFSPENVVLWNIVIFLINCINIQLNFIDLKMSFTLFVLQMFMCISRNVLRMKLEQKTRQSVAEPSDKHKINLRDAQQKKNKCCR